MEKKQEDAYKEAIEEYRAASQARLVKLSSKSLNSLAKALPKRQISNYFTQFRKVILSYYVQIPFVPNECIFHVSLNFGCTDRKSSIVN